MERILIVTIVIGLCILALLMILTAVAAFFNDDIDHANTFVLIGMKLTMILSLILAVETVIYLIGLAI